MATVIDMAQWAKSDDVWIRIFNTLEEVSTRIAKESENERWARICADNKDVADSFDRIVKEQQWYLPEVINDTEGDAKIIPFPSKKPVKE